MESELARPFLDASVRRLNQLAGRITGCLDRLTSEQIWARGTENENAAGNLVLHLCGNVRQWIGYGVGGLDDVRVRDREFSARGGASPAELKLALETTVREAVAIIEKTTAAQLLDVVTIQNYRLTKLEAIYHVVEHFSQHAGQIIYATKQFTGEDLGFYRHLSRPGHSETTP
jgi:uncharacterized damage-inducible protein DinB